MDSDDASVTDYRSQIGRMGREATERFLYEEFVRTYHAKRIRAWLQESPDLSWGGDRRITDRLHDLFGDIEETFLEDVGLVCESHHLDDVNDAKKYPVNKPYGRTRREEANVQYAAFLLRTSDLLHITKDRVPSMAAVIINPRNPKSQVEWAKQSAVRSVRPRSASRDGEGAEEAVNTIEVHATFKEAEGYFGLTAYLHYASRQVEATYNWSREAQATGTTGYSFPWRRIDTTHIEAKGFVAEPFEFSIDQAKILDLLTGHTLYNDTGVVVRELVQNSLDAVRLQAHVSDQPYVPRIDVTWDSEQAVLCVTDNGIGMTQSTIERNLLRVGSSRYQEPEFRKKFPDFTSISRFGIGVLSTFMVADDVSVSTSHDSELKARQLSLRDVHGQYLVRLVDKQAEEIPYEIRDHGTSVCLKLRPSAELKAVDEILRHWILFPACELWLTVDGGESERIGFDSVSSALTHALIDGNLARLDETGVLGAYGQPVEVRSTTSGGVELAYAVTWSRWLEAWQFVKVDPSRGERSDRKDPVLGLSVGGIRVTVEPPGFRHGGVAAMANATGKGSPRTNVARSAIERTDEYDDLLQRVYAGYAEHISSEMRAMSSERAASLTRAAREASFLAEDIAMWPAESAVIRQSVLRTVPAVVIEEAGTRETFSLADLEGRAELSSIESTTISSFESLLWSVRGPGSPTLAKLLEALGSEERLPELPLICGLGEYGVLSRMFTAEWEVSRIESDNESRTLRATWKRRSTPPRWRRPRLPSDVPPSVLRGLQRNILKLREGGVDSILLAANDDIEVVNLSQSLVLCQSRMLVLPGSPFLGIEAASTEVSDSARDWGMAYVIWITTEGSPRRRAGQFYTSDRSLQHTAEWAAFVTNHLSASGIFEVLSAESVREAIETADLAVLDVNRWDQRKGSDE